MAFADGPNFVPTTEKVTMTRILPGFGRLIVALVAAVMLSATVPGIAHATDPLPTAYLYRYLTLTNDPNQYMDTAEAERDIELVAGYYHFRFNVVREKLSMAVPGSYAQKDVYLAKGTYKWSCL